jgi:hypothetical protein
MGQTWVLHTETKGTGATVVPLKRSGKHASPPEPLSVPRKAMPRKPADPKPRPPHRFRVVDVMTRQILVDDADGPRTIVTLRGIRSIVDVDVYVWQPERERWRRLSFAEQRALFDVAASRAATEDAR